MSNITIGFEYVGEEFEKCPDCGEGQQTVGFKKLVIVLRHDDKIRGYKCSWCRGKLTTKKGG